MFINVDQLQKQLDKDEFQEDGSMAAFWMVNNQFQKFIDSQFSLDYDSQMTEKYFVEYTGIEVKQFRDTLLQHMGNVKKSVAKRTRHQRQYDRRVNKGQMLMQESKIDTGKAVDADLVITESNGTESEVQDESSRSGNDTNDDDADIRPIYDEEPMTEVHLTAECNIFAIGQQHTEQPEIINEGRVDQYPEQCQVKSLMLDSSPDNETTDNSKQSLESENILLKKTVAQFQKDFSRMEAHCIALELKYQNQALKSGQHGQIWNETSNKAKIKKEIDVLEIMNIELEHSVAKLRKENKTLKKHYKDLYDSIKITRSKTIEHTTSFAFLIMLISAQDSEKGAVVGFMCETRLISDERVRECDTEVKDSESRGGAGVGKSLVYRIFKRSTHCDERKSADAVIIYHSQIREDLGTMGLASLQSQEIAIESRSARDAGTLTCWIKLRLILEQCANSSTGAL
ncbi:hypothetical protein Tco_0835560 [Tanacetum coccineum]